MKKPHIVFKNREKKAKKIFEILRRFKPKGKSLLSIGIGSGEIEDFFVKKGFEVFGVDVVDERTVKSFSFKQTGSEILPFKRDTFDIVISNHVIEHVHDQNTHLSEVKRVLKSTGLCYLATPNKYSLIEPHYRLPLLSWIPKELASKILHTFRMNDHYDVNPLSRSKLRSLAEKNSFILSEETKLALSLFVNDESNLSFLGDAINILYPITQLFIPTLVVILKKGDDN